MTEKDYKTALRMITYERIHHLRDVEHRSIQRIADDLGLNFRTVKKYLEMSHEEFEAFTDSIIQKPFVLEPYKEFIVQRLSLYPDTSAAQMHDWLKENYPKLPALSPKTVYNYVMKLRSDYSIPKVTIKERQYKALPLTPPGVYAQVDFGQKKLRTSNGKMRTVYFMAMLLCNSRHKFIYFQDKPFTSESAVTAHERSFEYFKGIPKNIIYDQDAVFLYDENIGDYVMTAVFGSYVKSRPFNAVFCRPADPESKGKVENCVKYVKQNFLHNRTYTTLDNLNKEAVAWLNRTGNVMLHGTTCKVPYDEWCKECKDLHPYYPVAARKQADGHQVTKTNSVKYRGNIYSVPLGTYRDDTSRVLLVESNGDLIISTMDGKEIARHIIPSGRGNTVINDRHYQDTSTKLQDAISEIEKLFRNESAIKLMIAELKARYPRHMRDHLTTIQTCIVKYGQEVADAALEQCISKRLYSANDFKAFAESLKKPEPEATPEIKPLGDESARMLANFDPGRSSIITYQGVWNS